MYTRIHTYTYIRIQLPVLHTLIQVFRSTASSFAKQLSEDERESPPRASSTFDLEPLSLEESPEHEGLPRLILAHSSSLPSSLRLLLRLLRSFDLRFLFFSLGVFSSYTIPHTHKPCRIPALCVFPSGRGRCVRSDTAPTLTLIDASCDNLRQNAHCLLPLYSVSFDSIKFIVVK